MLPLRPVVEAVGEAVCKTVGEAVTAIFVSAFATLFVVIDPIGSAPIFAGLTATATVPQRRMMAVRSVLIAAVVLLVFALVGERLLEALGISLAAFRVAGGVTLFLVALDMIFDKSTKRREEQAREVTSQPEHLDISVFPMAIPMIAGPGSIASVMLLMSQGPDWTARGEVLAALAAVLVLTVLALLAAAPLMQLAGQRIEAMLTRILGVILSALAAQFVLDGVRASLG